MGEAAHDRGADRRGVGVIFFPPLVALVGEGARAKRGRVRGSAADSEFAEFPLHPRYRAPSASRGEGAVDAAGPRSFITHCLN
jgi:hypothetical protein